MAVKCFSLYLILAAIVIGGVNSEYIEYNTKPRIVPEKINVHLVPHSHDDVGWLKTVDQYYVGSNNSIRGACVQNVLDSVIASLLDDENRKFIYVEMAFFQRWWRQQSNAKKVKVKKLVDSGQLEFINGGMCMHDEATPHYIDMIDQTTLGHQFIKTEFGQVPRVGWQIDPFGHSAAQAYLLGAELGFDSLFFARIDYQDRAKRLREKTLEVIWQGSKSLGSSSQIFTGVFPRHYDPPDGFTFEINDVSAPVQDDPLLFDYNVQERVNDFVAAALAQVNVTRTNHIMWLMGTDFRYQYAYSWFRQMDKFIHYVNKDGRLNVLYSTPSIYTDAKYAANESWPLKTDDFFPYADKPNAYWTGYFTSRPAFKKYVRDLSGYYLAARQLEFLRGRNSSGPTTDMLADALAIAQHHDAVSGTQRQHVAADYALRLSMGYLQAEKLVASSLSLLSAAKSSTEAKNPGTKFKQCPLLNISYCPASEARLSSGKSLVVVVYNSLGWKREEVVRVPVSSANVIVKDSSGKEVVSQLLPLSDTALRIRNEYVKAYLGRSPKDTAKHMLAFTASVPPLGFSSYVISNTGRTARGLSASYVTSGSMNQNVDVGQGNLKLHYSEEGVKMTRYLSTRNQVTAEQSYAYYIGSNGTDKDPQASGAYVFRPDGVLPIKSKGEAQLTVVRGPLFDEVHQELNSWISQITRVYTGKNHAEIEFTVGPIPGDDGISKEVITKLTTTMKTNGTFYTDSNGRDFIKRVRDFRTDWDLQVYQPVAGNYYPINLGIYMQDKTSELSVLVDRAVGGSSLENGQIELMLHRRMQHDDIRGVGEILNETVCLPDGCKGLTIQGKFYVQIDKPGDGAKWRRTFGQEIYSPLLLAFTEQEGDSWINSHKTTFSAFEPSYSLPKNVALLTLQELENGEVLLRLAHLFEVGEDIDYSVLTKVELKKLFHSKKISEVTETSLSGNQEKAEMEKRRLIWKVEGSTGEEVKRGKAVEADDLVVELVPMEIRTFLIKFDDRITSAKSLWVDWIKSELLRHESFWSVKDSPHMGSWMWRKLLKYRQQAKGFSRKDIRSGAQTSFWYDTWCSLGPIHVLVGGRGFIDLGIPSSASVADALRDHRRRHHRLPILNRIESELDRYRNREPENAPDVALWRHKGDKFRPSFSTKDTWWQLRRVEQPQSWYKGVWFSASTPKFSFFTWLAALNRLSTGDRMYSWNPGVSTTCVLCNDPWETRDHLFFSCPFSIRIWENLSRGLLQTRYTSAFGDILSLLSSAVITSSSRFIIRYVFQATAHTIWGERNGRRHGETPHTSEQLIKLIDRLVRNRLLSLQRPGSSKFEDGLRTWLATRS